jgi:hypothetical protein
MKIKRRISQELSDELHVRLRHALAHPETCIPGEVVMEEMRRKIEKACAEQERTKNAYDLRFGIRSSH